MRIFLHVGDSVSEMTPLTKKWRIAIRGESYRQNEKAEIKSSSAMAWARRKAATNPKNAGKLRFGSKGELLNKVDLEGNLLD